jgi:DNA-binding XRE family transcriptional regulator
MSRTPSKPHVLRTARIQLGLTQAKLASLVGASTIAIKRIEGGSMKVSRQMAQRISTVTRLDFQQLLDNSEPESPVIYPASNEALSMEMIETETAQLALVIRDTLSRSKNPMRFWTLRNVMNQKLFEAREEFGLSAKTYRSRDVDWKATAARKRQLPEVLPGSDNGERKPANR